MRPGVRMDFRGVLFLESFSSCAASKTPESRATHGFQRFLTFYDSGLVCSNGPPDQWTCTLIQLKTFSTCFCANLCRARSHGTFIFKHRGQICSNDLPVMLAQRCIRQICLAQLFAGTLAAQGLMALLLFSIAGVFVPKPAAPPGSVVDCSHDTAGVADSNAVCRN